MPSTPRGIEYPDSSGHTRLWEHMQTAAETTDAAINDVASKAVQRGRASVVMGEAGSVYSLDVTFEHPYSAPPVVVATPEATAPNAVDVSVNSVTSTGFRMNAQANNTFSPRVVHWVAVGVPA